MRKNERIIREKRHNVPERYRKVDTTVNGDAETLVEIHREIEKKLYPLRIDKRTVIYVTKDKLTPEYAEEYRMNHMRITDGTKEKKGGNEATVLDDGELRAMLEAGMSVREMARNMGVSGSTVCNYIKKYGLKNEKR